MANIMSLSNELLHLVFGYVSVSCLLGPSFSYPTPSANSICEVYDSFAWDTNGSLALVNRRFNSLAFHSFTYRELIIRRGCDHDLFHEWITNPEKWYILRSIRSITISSRSKSPLSNPITKDKTMAEDEKERIIWKPVADLIANLKYLKHLRYVIEQPCPPILIDALEKHHPYAHLDIHGWGSYGERRYRNPDPQTDVHSLTLAKSPCLHRIETNFSYNRDDKYDFREAAFYHILAVAPRLTIVHLRYCSKDGVNSRPLEPEETDEFKRLAEPFVVEDPVRKAIKEIELKGHKLCLSSRWIEQWSTWTDLRKLECLQQYGEMHADFFTTAIAKNTFRSLKCLTLDLYTIPNFDPAVAGAINEFLLRCRPLESLSLTNRRDSVPLSAILTRHGQSLRALHLHEREASRRPDRYNNFLASPRVVFSVSEIKQIRDTCPYLSELTVDIDRSASTETEREIYALLATFPNLREINLHFDLGLTHVQRRRWRDDHSHIQPFLPPQFGSQYPILSDESVANIWSSIASAKVGARLEALHVKTGEKAGYFERSFFRTYWQEYEQEHRQEFTARPSSRDDRRGEVKVLEMVRDGGHV